MKVLLVPYPMFDFLKTKAWFALARSLRTRLSALPATEGVFFLCRESKSRAMMRFPQNE